MTKTLAVEWARDGIRVNAVAPTFVDTPMTRPMFADPEFRAEVLERRLPTGRLAEIDDVARAVRYLACDARPTSPATSSGSTAAGPPGERSFRPAGRPPTSGRMPSLNAPRARQRSTPATCL